MIVSKQMLKKALREVVREELKAALVRTITVQRGPDRNGDPEQRVESVEVNVLDFLAKYLPDLEGRLLGVQSDVDQARNRVGELVEEQRLIHRTLLGLEQPLKRVAALSDAVRPALEAMESNIKELPHG